MRHYEVGIVYRFWADDEQHAVEQYHNAVEGLDSTEVNFIKEVADDEG